MNIPKNSLSEKIKEIVSLCEELTEEYGEEASFFSAPASEDKVIEWENENKIIIPKSYKEWLMFSNGSQIINDTAHFFSLDMFDIHNSHIPADYVIIGEIIGDGELLCFSKTTEKIIRYNHGTVIEYQDFNEVLNLILEIV